MDDLPDKFLPHLQAYSIGESSSIPYRMFGLVFPVFPEFTKKGIDTSQKICDSMQAPRDNSVKRANKKHFDNFIQHNFNFAENTAEQKRSRGHTCISIVSF